MTHHDRYTPRPEAATIRAIADLTAALVAQDTATGELAAARRRLVRLAVAEGHTYTAIAAGTGITRQRVAQLAEGTE